MNLACARDDNANVDVYESAGCLTRAVVVLVASSLLTGCGESPRASYLRKQIDRWGLGKGKLCAAFLRFPAPLDSRQPQYWFEKVMLREGVLQVVRPPSRSRRATVAMAPRFSSNARAVTWLPGYRSICYGSVHATRIVSVSGSGDVLTVRFAYASSLDPWGTPLAPFLQLKNQGEETVLMAPSVGAPQNGLVVAAPVNAVNFRRILYPPKGENWYPPTRFPHGIPGALHHTFSV